MHSCSRFVCSDCAHSRAQRSFVPRLLSAAGLEDAAGETSQGAALPEGLDPRGDVLLLVGLHRGGGGAVCGTAVCDVAIPQLTLKSSCGGLRAALSPSPQKWTFLLRHGEKSVGLQEACPAASAQAASEVMHAPAASPQVKPIGFALLKRSI